MRGWVLTIEHGGGSADSAVRDTFPIRGSFPLTVAALIIAGATVFVRAEGALGLSAVCVTSGTCGLPRKLDVATSAAGQQVPTAQPVLVPLAESVLSPTASIRTRMMARAGSTGSTLSMITTNTRHSQKQL